MQRVVICCQSDYGAMKVVQHPGNPDGMPSVETRPKHADVAQHVVAEKCGHLHGEHYLRCLTEENVVNQPDHLRTKPAVTVGIARKSLSIHGWIFGIPDAAMRAFDSVQGTFVDVAVAGRALPKVAPVIHFPTLVASATSMRGYFKA